MNNGDRQGTSISRGHDGTVSRNVRERVLTYSLDHHDVSSDAHLDALLDLGPGTFFSDLYANRVFHEKRIKDMVVGLSVPLRVIGPAGSGKTSTIRRVLQTLGEEGHHTLTIDFKREIITDTIPNQASEIKAYFAKFVRRKINGHLLHIVTQQYDLERTGRALLKLTENDLIATSDSYPDGHEELDNPPIENSRFELRKVFDELRRTGRTSDPTFDAWLEKSALRQAPTELAQVGALFNQVSTMDRIRAVANLSSVAGSRLYVFFDNIDSIQSPTLRAHVENLVRVSKNIVGAYGMIIAAMRPGTISTDETPDRGAHYYDTYQLAFEELLPDPDFVTSPDNLPETNEVTLSSLIQHKRLTYLYKVLQKEQNFKVLKATTSTIMSIPSIRHILSILCDSNRRLMLNGLTNFMESLQDCGLVDFEDFLIVSPESTITLPHSLVRKPNTARFNEYRVLCQSLAYHFVVGASHAEIGGRSTFDSNLYNPVSWIQKKKSNGSRIGVTQALAQHIVISICIYLQPYRDSRDYARYPTVDDVIRLATQFELDSIMVTNLVSQFRGADDGMGGNLEVYRGYRQILGAEPIEMTDTILVKDRARALAGSIAYHSNFLVAQNRPCLTATGHLAYSTAESLDLMVGDRGLGMVTRLLSQLANLEKELSVLLDSKSSKQTLERVYAGIAGRPNVRLLASNKFLCYRGIRQAEMYFGKIYRDELFQGAVSKDKWDHFCDVTYEIKESLSAM